MTLNYIKKLCTPAYIYLVISVIAIIIMMFQNCGNVDTYSLGSYECSVTNTALVFFIEFLYVAFWTFILDSVCKAGHKQFSWFIVLFPFILSFVLLGMMLVIQGAA
jgi:hypothetical protein